jgi:hypothetical protein
MFTACTQAKTCYFSLAHAQDGNTALLLSSACGRVDVVRLLLDRKANIKTENKVLTKSLHSVLLVCFPPLDGRLDVLIIILTAIYALYAPSAL